jgi:RNA polymerase sigma-70 factor, ECF subfamily
MEQNYGNAMSGSVLDNRLEDASRTVGESDKRLVEKAMKGDAFAFEMLVAQHARKVYFSVYRITKNREDAEDVMQEAFVQAYRHIASFEGRCRFRTWFTTIAINQALMCLRKRKKHCVYIPVSAGDDPKFSLSDIPDARPSAEVEVEKRELACLLGKAANLLPHRLRSVFYLRALDEMSTREVAQALGLSVTAVKSRMLRARRYLERRVAKHGPKHRLIKTHGSHQSSSAGISPANFIRKP